MQLAELDGEHCGYERRELLIRDRAVELHQRLDVSHGRLHLVDLGCDQVALGLEDKSFAGPVMVSEVNGPDIKAMNDFGKTLVKTNTSTVAASGNAMTYSFPPHSYTQLKGNLA